MDVEIYIKKPVAIEAVQWDGSAEKASDIIDWILSSGGTAVYGCDSPLCTLTDLHSISISTLEGRMEARAGDYIIKGIKGEFYPCKPDIFVDSYQSPIDYGRPSA